MNMYLSKGEKNHQYTVSNFMNNKQNKLGSFLSEYVYTIAVHYSVLFSLLSKNRFPELTSDLTFFAPDEIYIRSIRCILD